MSVTSSVNSRGSIGIGSLRTTSSPGVGRRKAVSAGIDKTSDKYSGSAGHTVAEADVVSIDCTNRGIQLVEDHLVKVKFTLGHLSMEIVAIDRVKGRLSVELTNSTGDIAVMVRLGWRMKFEVMWQGKKHRGHLLLESITRDILMKVIEPFPIGIQWFNDKSPEGIEFNQVCAILRSSRCREKIRERYLEMEKQLVKEYMPRFQKARTNDYANQEGKKRAIYDLTQVSDDLVRTESSRKGSAYTPMTRMKKEKGKKAEHDHDTGVALGEIGDYHGMAPSHHQSLQDFAFGDGASVGSLGSGSFTAGSMGAGSLHSHTHTAGSIGSGPLGTPVSRQNRTGTARNED